MPRKLAESSGLYRACLASALLAVDAARPGSGVDAVAECTGKSAFDASVRVAILERTDRALIANSHETMALIDRGAIGLMALTIEIVSGAIRDAMSADAGMAA